MKRTRYRGIMEIEPGRYEIRSRGIDPATGNRKEVTHRVSCSLREAHERQTKWKQEIEEGATRAARVRLGDYAASWLSSKAPLLKPSTRRKYATTLDLHILPALGDMYLDALRPLDVQEWVSAQQAKGRAGWSIVNDLRVLRTVCRDAMADLDLPRDPVARVRAPRGREYTSSDPNCLDAAELGKLVDALRTHEPEWLAVVMTMGFTGLRFGEVSALKWGDVDWSGTLIRIERSNWKGIITDTKTHKDRSVPMVPELADVLREHRRRQIEAQHPGLAAGWIFPTRAGGIHKGSILVPILARTVPKAGIAKRLTPHGLRRTFNDLCRRVASGVVVRGIMGHATEAMTEHYSFVSASEKLAASTNVLRLVTEAKQQQAQSEKGEQKGEPSDRAQHGSPDSPGITGGAARI